MSIPKPIALQSLAWLLAGSVGLAAWGLLMLQAVAEAGPAGYFADLARSPAYLLAWISLLVGFQFLITAAQRSTAWRWVEVRAGGLLGWLPEVLLTVPVVAGAEVGTGTWFLGLDRLVDIFQLPGRALMAPFGEFDRWAVGLTDPGSAWVARELAMLNFANLLGWVAIGLVVGWGVRRFAGAAKTRS